MNLALITAAGIGNRMNNATPKQFVFIQDKPILIYTLQAFQNHPMIDAICVACLAGWENTLAKYAEQYGITKLKHIVTGGETNQDSIRLGLTALSNNYADDDIVLIHDGVRPLVSEEVITDCIKTVKSNGNAIAAIPCTEAPLITTDEGHSSTKFIPRETLKRTQTPHGFHLIDIVKAHEQAQEQGIKNTVASCNLLIELGHRVFFSTGSEKNIKLTTPDDFDIFKAMLKAEK